MFTELFDRYTHECLKEIETVVNEELKIFLHMEYNPETSEINIHYNDSVNKVVDSFVKPELSFTDFLPCIYHKKSGKSKTRRCYGSFNCTDNSISLNVKAIEQKAKECKENPENLLKVILCHELFHAVHFHLANVVSGEAYWLDNRTNSDARMVIESLAIVVMTRICKNLGVDAKGLIYDRLVERMDEDTPYNGAIYLVRDVINDDKAAFEKTAYILKKSLKSWKEAASFLKWTNSYYIAC